MRGEIVLNKNEQFALKIIEDFRSGRCTRKSAANLLGGSERTISNIAARNRVNGAAGIKHGNPKKNALIKKTNSKDHESWI